MLLDVNVVFRHTAETTLITRACATGSRDASLRLATNRRIFEVPTPRSHAFAFIDATRAQPLHLSVAPGPRHLSLLRRLCDEGDASGDLITDAVIAAVAAEHSCEIVTLDRDFARFGSVRHRRPD